MIHPEFTDEIKIDAPYLFRMGIIAALWAEYASRFLLIQNLTLQGLAVSALFFLSSSAIFLGWQSRWAALALGSLMFYARVSEHDIVDPMMTHQHHYFLFIVALFYSSLIPKGHFFPLSMRQGQESKIRWQDHWSIPILKAILSSIYFYAAISKLTPDSLSGAHLEVQLVHYYFGSISTPGYSRLVGFTLNSLVLGSELILAVGVWFREVARLLFFPAVCMHICMYLVLPIQTFSVVMIMLWALLISGMPSKDPQDDSSRSIATYF